MKCGRTLTDPVSVMLRIGPVCRLTNKNKTYNEQTINMFSNSAVYDWWEEDNIIFIEDKGTIERSVTNDIENVLQDIKQTGQSLEAKKIIYKDSYGVWDGINHDNGTNISFYSINEIEYLKAKQKTLLLK